MKTNNTIQDRIKNAFLTVLPEKKYEQITVTELCQLAHISRVTFYSYFPDKDSLLDSVMKDYLDEITARALALQEENNPSNDATLAYWNYYDALIDGFSKYPFLLRISDLDTDRPVYSFLYRYLLDYTEALTRTYLDPEASRFTPLQTASFICNGIFSFLIASRTEGISVEQQREDTHELIRYIIASGLFDSSRQYPVK